MPSSTMPQSVIGPAAQKPQGDAPSGPRSDAEALSDAVALAAMVGSRLCHDLVSPLGAIGNGVELIEMALPYVANSPEMRLVNDSLHAARARLDLYRMAFGQAGTQQRLPPAEVQALITGLADGSRLHRSGLPRCLGHRRSWGRFPDFQPPRMQRSPSLRCRLPLPWPTPSRAVVFRWASWH